MEPMFGHGCSACRFLGTYDKCDLYFCPQHTLPTVIARFGNANGDYVSGLTLARNHDLHKLLEQDGTGHIAAVRVAYLIAVDLQLLKP